jgi:hypothetical protein
VKIIQEKLHEVVQNTCYRFTVDCIWVRKKLIIDGFLLCDNMKSKHRKGNRAHFLSPNVCQVSKSGRTALRKFKMQVTEVIRRKRYPEM